MNEEIKKALIVAFVVIAGLLAFSAMTDNSQSGSVVVDCPDGRCDVRWANSSGQMLREALADIPFAFREQNYAPYDSGSCVHAATVTLLKWQGRFKEAEWWRNNYHSGEYAERLIKRMESAGLRYAYTFEGDVRFLEWATRNRMAAGIFYKPRHAINIVELDSNYAVLLDNNNTGRYEYIPRAEFERRWRNEFGGFAWTVVYQPSPPWPEF